jgi:4-hydroxy-tetrahydrodipicolinate synthase
MSVMAPTSLAYYCGIDELNLPYLACGATGVVSVVGNVVAGRNAELMRAVRSGDLDAAKAIQGSLIPLVDAIMRLPLLEPEPPHLRRLTDALAAIAVHA